MKHLKIFEEFDDDDELSPVGHYTSQHVGDYVKLEDYVKLDDSESELNVVGPFVKIIEVNDTDFDENDDDMYEPRYKVISIHKKTRELKEFWIGESEIDRDLTSSEIEELELLLTANKFNM